MYRETERRKEEPTGEREGGREEGREGKRERREKRFGIEREKEEGSVSCEMIPVFPLF